MLIDTHTHLYSEKFQDDIDEVVQRAIDHDVQLMLMPNVDSSSIDAMFELHQNHSDHCLPMVGLHPCSVKADYQEELDKIKTYLTRENVVAVGELGIDLYWDTTYKKQQIEAFHQQIDWALEMDLPIVIHARNAINECIEVVTSRQNGNLRGVFHCFDQGEEEALQIIDLGFYLGIGGVLTFKKSKLPEAIQNLPLDRIILETDSPYLAPTPFRGKRNESAYVSHVADKMVDVFGVAREEIVQVTTSNAKELFRLDVF